MEDGVALEKLNETKLRLKLERMWKIKGKLNMRASTTETTLLREGLTSPTFDWNFNCRRFTGLIFPDNLRTKDLDEIRQLWELFKENESAETIDLRAYCFLDFIMFASTETNFDNIVRLVFRVSRHFISSPNWVEIRLIFDR